MPQRQFALQRKYSEVRGIMHFAGDERYKASPQGG
jgi:hypothetical protein